MTGTDGVSTQEGPTSNWDEVWYDQERNFKFIRCEDTNEIIWPFQKAWKFTYWNCGGAIVGAPPIKMSKIISDKAYMVRILKGKLGNDPIR